MTVKPGRKRARLGDVLEIATPAGLAYFQYTHQHPVYGGLICVLQGTYEARPAPEEIASLARRSERFVTFLPVRGSANRGLVTIVANEPIPPHAKPFPIFKSGRPGNWWLWDGEREWRVGQLTVEQRALPSRGVWNAALLASRIASGWSPEDDATALN
jgi:hypothetical protein